MILRILSCRMSENMDTLFAFYASSRDDAEQQARKILQEQGYDLLDLKEYPYGFVMHHSRISGTLEEGCETSGQILLLTCHFLCARDVYPS